MYVCMYVCMYVLECSRRYTSTMAFSSTAVWLHLQKVLDYFSCSNVLLAVERLFGRPNDAKLALVWRSCRSGDTKLTLERHVGGSSGAKLALEWLFGRQMASSWPWIGVLVALSRFRIGIFTAMTAKKLFQAFPVLRRSEAPAENLRQV